MTSMAEGDYSEEISITLDDGRVITMTRTEEGQMELCNGDEACVSLPTTAPEFLAIYEFFQTMERKKK